MERENTLQQDRIFWAQKYGSTRFNDGEYKLRLLNDKVVGVGDVVLVKFDNGNFKGRVKQVAGFGLNEDRAIISVLFPGRNNGKKVHIDNVLDKL